MNRRIFMGQSATALGLLTGLSGPARAANLQKAEVIVIGGGYGGATAAKYIRLLSNNTARVTIIEPNSEFYSCPMSNLVVGGSRTMSELRVSYDNLSKRHGIKMVKDSVVNIDAANQTVQLASGKSMKFDKVVLSPGIGLMMDSIQGLAQANQAGVTLQAWKAGPETVALHNQIAAMREGGVFAITIPEAP